MKTSKEAVLAHWIVRDHVRMVLVMAGAAFTLVNAGCNARMGTASVGVACNPGSIDLVETMLRSVKPSGRIRRANDATFITVHWNLV